MDRKTTLQLMAILQAAYPAFYARQTEADAKAAANLWADIFADDDPKIVFAATKALIATRTSTYPPVIGEIREKMLQLTSPVQMSELEAWGLVKAAISNSCYNSREEFAKLPPIIQRLVGSPDQLREWAMMDCDEVATVIASNFQRSFRTRQRSDREIAMLPASVQDMVGKLAAGMQIPALPSDRR